MSYPQICLALKLLKDILLYLMVFNTLASTLAVPLIYMDFSARREYIAEVLCINKDKPMLNCNGQCYLAKKLKAAQEQQDKENESVNVKTAPYFFSQTFDQISFARAYSLIIQKYQNKVLYFVFKSFLSEVFVPPRY